jgi:hypothetical protein
MCHPSPLSLSLSCGSPKGCIGARSTPSLHDEVLEEFRIGSKPIYFRNLGWIRDPEGVIVHRIGTSTMRYCTYDTKSLRWYYCTSIVASRSSRPWDRLHRLHRRRLCGSIIPTFNLQGYVIEALLIVSITPRYILGNSGLRSQFFFCYLHQTPTTRIVLCLKIFPQSYLFKI